MTRLDEITGGIRTIGVVGLGTMGAGIVQVALQSGHSVVGADADELARRRGKDRVESGLRKMAEKGKLPADSVDPALARFRLAESLEDLADVDLAVEAVVEREGPKLEVFRELDRVCRHDTVLATNTSSISITRLAAATGRPDRFVGMHFMNPVPLMKLVELIRGLETSDDAFERVRNVVLAMEKTPVEVNDFPGFVSNRVLMPMINEAVYCLMEGVGDAEAIDQVMKLGMNHPMGPLALADLIGLDVCLDILRVLHAGFGDPKYRPCPLLVKMVDAGRLGRKAGRGFHAY
jgi:3-hydroxybutyryl-CoA dehydrogenase